jgi:hypothetical protein
MDEKGQELGGDWPDYNRAQAIKSSENQVENENPEQGAELRLRRTDLAQKGGAECPGSADHLGSAWCREQVLESSIVQAGAAALGINTA